MARMELMKIIEILTATPDMKTIFLALSAALLAFTSSAQAVDLGFKAGRTPYDRYMTPVNNVLSEVTGAEDSLRDVTRLMKVGRRFRYSFNRPYTAMPPSVTERTRSGDCKDKALWLLSRMNDDSARFVIGKATSRSAISHAWVMWENNGRWWVLDCTNNSRPIPADSLSRNQYIPLYSYAKDGVYVHTATRTASVASNTQPVAGWGNRR